MAIQITGNSDELAVVIMALTTFQYLAQTDQLPVQCGPEPHMVMTRDEALSVAQALGSVVFTQI